MKKTITLDAIDPIEIFGVGNKILEEFCSYFHGLKVVARGNEIHLDGKENDIQEFSQKFAELIDRRMHKMSLTVFDVEDIFDGENSPNNFRLNGEAIIVHGTDGKPIKARNKTQQEMVKAYFDSDLVFAVGPAGTGKTYIAIALAVRALKNREVKRIILTRPAVEAGERLGFLPGDLKDKLDPYLQPLYDALGDMVPVKKLQEFMSDGTIQIAPLAYMRGRTLDRACVILDEAQNTNLAQLKMFLTRMGANAKFIVTGDATQVDLPNKEDSGLLKGIRLIKDIKGVSTIFFSNEDIVRHPLVSKIVKAFDRKEAEDSASAPDKATDQVPSQDQDKVRD
jgi:phosphate starvation-inducible protein PhoH and related proteins